MFGGGERIPFFNCCWEEAVSKYVCRVSNLQELTVMLFLAVDQRDSMTSMIPTDSCNVTVFIYNVQL